MIPFAYSNPKIFPLNLSTVDNLLHVGTSQSPITPPIGFTISGPEFPDRPSHGIDDDLYIRCVTLRSYGKTAAIVSLDVWGIAEQLRNSIASAVSDVVGIPSENVLITCTNNGTSPPLWRDDDGLPNEYANYLAYLPDVAAGAALDAALSLQPAAIGTVTTNLPNLSCFADGTQEEHLESERETLTLAAAFTADGQINCLLYNLACPTTVVGNTLEWTADFPGVASGSLEQAGVDTAIFIQGASAGVRPFDWWDGNINISHAERTWQDAQAFGILLATQAIRATANIVPRRNARIGAAISEDGETTAFRLGDAILMSRPFNRSQSILLMTCEQQFPTLSSWSTRIPSDPASIRQAYFVHPRSMTLSNWPANSPTEFIGEPASIQRSQSGIYP